LVNQAMLNQIEAVVIPGDPVVAGEGINRSINTKMEKKMEKKMETKKWYQSKSLWGSIIVVVAMILRLFDKESLAENIEAESTGIVEWVSSIVSLIGAAMAFYGRLTADKKIVR